jgi:hypothetical protein
MDRCPPKLDEPTRHPSECSCEARIDWPGVASLLKQALGRHDWATLLLSPVTEWNAKLERLLPESPNAALHKL